MQREIIDLTGPGIQVYNVQYCAICLEELGSNGPALWLGCHVFCRGCIHAWGSDCPTCRRSIPDELKGPRRSPRQRKATMMFTTNGVMASAVPSDVMVQRVDDI